MRIIVTHDVDLLNTRDHRFEAFLVKRVARSLVEGAAGRCSRSEVMQRVREILADRINHLDALIGFDLAHGVRSTFFFGMANGLHLNYSREAAKPWVVRVMAAGLDVGVHGISYDDPEAIREEHDAFQALSGLDRFGNRMHYLRMSDRTLGCLARAGYLYDSSVESLEAPFRRDGIWEFPVNIMDVTLFCRGSRWINQSFDQAAAATEAMIRAAHAAGHPYFTVLLHDTYFTPAYRAVHDWYVWLIEYAREAGYPFSSFQDAIRDLESP